MYDDRKGLDFWRHPMTHTILGAALGALATFGGAYWGFVLSVRQELANYQDQVAVDRIGEIERDNAHASALASQLRLNREVAARNLRSVESEIRSYPEIHDLIPLMPMLEFEGVGPGVSFPGVIGRDSLLRTQALEIMLDVRAINASSPVRDEIRRARRFSGLVFEGTRPGDSQPGDVERDSLNRRLRTHHRRVVSISDAFLGRYDSLTH